MGVTQAVIRELDESTRSRCAIMFTDILGFTGLMRDDEQKTIQKLESHRHQLEILHEKFNGRIIQFYGDGSLSVFSSSRDAVECAIAIQEQVIRLGLPLKIGLHYGDIVEKGTAVYGDGINVASRIESIGIARSILFSEAFWKTIRNEGFEVNSLGVLRFKNVRDPMKVFSLVHSALVTPDKKMLEGKLEEVAGRKYKKLFVISLVVFAIITAGLWGHLNRLRGLLDDEITTLGVLPFRFSGLDGLDENFRAGLLENVVTSLSSFYGLQVLSSRATESYAESNIQPMQIGQTLGASHLLYGTCRKAGQDSVRINLELVDARNGRNVWAKSLVKDPDDLFEDPGELTTDLAVFLKGKNNPYYSEVTTKVPRMSATSFRLLTEAKEEASKRTREGLELSNELLSLAIKRDSSLSMAYALKSQNYALMHAYGYIDADSAMQKAEENSGLALFMDRNLAEAYASNALMLYSFFQAEPAEILDLLQQALLLRPSYDYAYHLMGKIHLDLLNYESAIQYFSQAAKLNPDEYLYQKMLAVTLEAAGEKNKARRIYENLLKKDSHQDDAVLSLAKFYLHQGDKAKMLKVLSPLVDEQEKMQMELYYNLKHGDLPEAQRIYQLLQASFPHVHEGPTLVLYFDKMGDYPEVWKILEKAVANKAIWLKGLLELPLESFRQNPKSYQKLLDQIKLTPIPVEQAF